jgi:predicted PurR-regulated permease PerM
VATPARTPRPPLITDAPAPAPSTAAAARAAVPVRLVLSIIGLVLAAIGGLLLLWSVRRILALVLIAAFFAVVLNPAVNRVQRLGIKRGLATLIVFLAGVGLFGGMTYAFVRPISRATSHFADNVPKYVEQAQNGEGRVGRLVKRYKVDDYVRKQAPELRKSARRAASNAFDLTKKLLVGVAGFLTVLVLSFLMLMEGPGLVGAVLAALPDRSRDRVARVGRDVTTAVSGYVLGNVLISIVAGTVCFVTLAILRVPFAFVLALWVAFADLLPLVGATIGAVPATIVAFLHSTTAGIVVLVMFIVYQQFENHVLQQAVMSRTVNLNPLWVLLSVLLGVELAGIIGALLAIPAAGAIQVIARDIWDERRGRPKPEPTLGPEQEPLSSATEG